MKKKPLGEEKISIDIDNDNKKISKWDNAPYLVPGELDTVCGKKLELANTEYGKDGSITHLYRLVLGR